MPVTKSQRGYGAQLWYSDVDASPFSYTKLIELVSIAGLGTTRPRIDMTHLESPDDSIEKIGGMKEGNTTTLLFNTTVDNIDVVQDLVDANENLEWKLVWLSTSGLAAKTRYFRGIPLTLDHGTIDAPSGLRQSMSIEISRAISKTPPVPGS